VMCVVREDGVVREIHDGKFAAVYAVANLRKGKSCAKTEVKSQWNVLH
jgi:hypothetical protein